MHTRKQPLRGGCIPRPPAAEAEATPPRGVSNGPLSRARLGTRGWRRARKTILSRHSILALPVVDRNYAYRNAALNCTQGY